MLDKVRARPTTHQTCQVIIKNIMKLISLFSSQLLLLPRLPPTSRSKLPKPLQKAAQLPPETCQAGLTACCAWRRFHFTGKFVIYHVKIFVLIRLIFFCCCCDCDCDAYDALCHGNDEDVIRRVMTSQAQNAVSPFDFLLGHTRARLPMVYSRWTKFGKFALKNDCSKHHRRKGDAVQRNIH